MRFGILAIVAASCQALAFPPFDWTALAWIAPLPVFLLFPAARAGRGIAAAWLAGTLGAAAIVTPWLWPTMAALLDQPLAIRVLLLVGVWQITGGVPLALLGAILQRIARLPPPARVLAAPAAWVAVEYLRAHGPLGTPWALLGAALSGWSQVAQVADLGGVYAVSFVAALASAALREVIGPALIGRDASAAAHGRRAHVAAVLVAAVLIVATLAYGAWRKADIERRIARAPTLRVALVHADVPSSQSASALDAVAQLERYLALSPPPGSDLDLVVWPENAVPLLLADNPQLILRIQERAGRVPYLVGAPRMTSVDGIALLRAAALLVRDGGIIASYDKRRLLPFAETAPWWRSSSARAGARSFTTGTSAAVLPIDDAVLGPLICYEAIFPDLAREAVRAGADVLVNVSNDAWFEHGSGARQHHLFTRLRAIETRRALVRVANRGTTAVVSPSGDTSFASDGWSAGVAVVSVPLLRTRSVYARLGDAFALACIGGMAIAVVLASARRARA